MSHYPTITTHCYFQLPLTEMRYVIFGDRLNQEEDHAYIPRQSGGHGAMMHTIAHNCITMRGRKQASGDKLKALELIQVKLF